jgi:hypothetical protein
MDQPGPRWPSPQDYNEAVQTADASFADADLRQANPECSLLGLPRATSGSFASVYKMSRGINTYAVRFFLRPISEQSQRYAHLSNFIMADNLPYTVPFSYDELGVKIRSDRYPLVKMEWVTGLTLDEYIKRNLNDSECLRLLAERFTLMCRQLREAGVAHGDLQHGNILVIPGGELRLVDYDGMFVPAMAGQRSMELGHRNYQHPGRTAMDFGVYLDNFSSLVINSSIRALSLAPTLFHQLHAGDECLLFRQRDYVDPVHSQAFHALEGHENEEIVRLAKIVRWQLKALPREVLTIDEIPEHLPDLDSLEEHRAPAVFTPSPRMVPGGKTTLKIGDDGRHILFSLRKVVHDEFAHPKCMFHSRHLHKRFMNHFFRRDLTERAYTLFLLMFIILPSVATHQFQVAIAAIVIMILYQTIKFANVVSLLDRAAKRVRHSTPVRVDCMMRMLPAGYLSKKIEYELVMLSEPPPANIAASTYLGSDPHLLDIYAVNQPVEDFVFADRQSGKVIARVTDQKIDWFVP